MLKYVDKEEIYKEEVSIVGSVCSLSLWWLLRQVLMSLCAAGPLISSFVQKCAKILTLLTLLVNIHNKQFHKIFYKRASRLILFY